MSTTPGWGAPGDPPEGPSAGWTRPSSDGADDPAAPPGWSPVQPPAGPPPPWGGTQPGLAAGGWAPPPPKPGVIPLRPLGVGEILDGAVSTMRANPRAMLGLSAIVAALAQLVQIPVQWLLLRDAGDLALSGPVEPGSAAESADLLAGTLSTLLITGLVTAVAALILTGILTVVVSRAVLGEHLGIGAAWAMARGRLPGLFGVTVVVFLAVMAVVAACLLPGLVLAAAGSPGPVVALALVIGVPLAVVLAVYLYVSWALAPPAVVLEKQRILASLSRSRELVRGAWWRTFGLLLLVNVLSAVIFEILGIPFDVLAAGTAYMITGDALDLFGFWPLVISGLGSVIAATITWPFVAAATALVYVDRRMRREGLDIELARAAGPRAR